MEQMEQVEQMQTKTPKLRKLKVHVANDHTAVLTFNVPEKLNALDADCHEDIHDFLDFVVACSQIRVVVVTGAGDKSFTSGMDISNLTSLASSDNPNMAKVIFGDNRFKEAADRVENLPKPVIAAINGYCIGGGVEFAMACDIRIASDNAIFKLPEVGLGIIPGAGGIQRIARTVGVGLAKELALTARKLSAQEAYEKGLINKVTTQANLMDEALKWASQIAVQAPLAVQLAKLCANMATDTPRSAASAMEALMQAYLDETDDAKEGPNSFLEKRPPKFTGR